MEELREVARWVSGLGLKDLPGEARRKAVLPIMDCLGVALAGLDDDSAVLAARWVKAMGGNPSSTVLRDGTRTAAAWAALANGTAAHALDYDDVCFRMIGHPSVALVPAVLALAEERRMGGSQCILAYVAGLEVAAKGGQALGGNPYAIGWHMTSTMGTLGAAAACSRLLELGEEETAHALGIACSMANGVRANFGTMTKPLHAGLAAMQGVMAAQLAEGGFTSNPDCLFGENGLARCLSGDTHRAGEMAPSLGRPWELLDPGLSFKPYPCCRGPQGAIDAALQVREQMVRERGGVDPAELERVECWVPSWLRGVLTYHRPSSGLEGKFSLEFCVSVALLDGKVGVRQFTDERVAGEDISLVISRFQWQDLEGEATSPFAARLEVRTTDGAVFGAEVERPLGEPGNAMSEEQLRDKYLECVQLLRSREVAERTLEMLQGLEDLENAGELMSLYAT